MNKKFIENLIELLQKSLKISEKEDVIEDLFKSREEEIHRDITKNEDYKECLKKINKINEEIIGKFKNYEEIIDLIEKHNDADSELGHLVEKTMYKCGLLDGFLIAKEIK